jgi:hypothetical protein
LRHINFFTLMVLGILISTLFVPVSALAATVEKYEGAIEDTFSIDCGRFEAILHAVSYYQGTAMFDREGNLVRDQTQWFLKGSITNVTTGETVYLNDRVNTQVMTDKDRWMTTGTFESITVPGEGLVSLFNGKFLFDLETFEMTLHLGPQRGNICAAVD